MKIFQLFSETASVFSEKMVNLMRKGKKEPYKTNKQDRASGEI